MSLLSVSHQPQSMQAPLRQTAPIQGRPHTYRLDNAFIDDWGERIGAHAIAVYNVLARYANRQTGECYPAIATIARKTRLSPNTVKKALRQLKRHQLIDWQPRVDAAGDAASHRYTVFHAADAWRQAQAGGGSSADGPQAPAGPGSINPCQGGRSAADTEQDFEQGFLTSAQDFPIALEDNPSQPSTPQLCTGPHTWERWGDFTHACKQCEAHHTDCRCFNCRLADTPTAPLETPAAAPEAAPPMPEVAPEMEAPPIPAAGAATPAAAPSVPEPQGPAAPPAGRPNPQRLDDDLLRQYATIAAESETPAEDATATSSESETPAVVLLYYLAEA